MRSKRNKPGACSGARVRAGERVYTETFGNRAQAVNALEEQRGKLMEQGAGNVQVSPENARTAAAETQQNAPEAGVTAAETQQTGAEQVAPMGDTTVQENAVSRENPANIEGNAQDNAVNAAEMTRTDENGQNNAETVQDVPEAEQAVPEEAEEKAEAEPDLPNWMKGLRSLQEEEQAEESKAEKPVQEEPMQEEPLKEEPAQREPAREEAAQEESVQEEAEAGEKNQPKQYLTAEEEKAEREAIVEKVNAELGRMEEAEFGDRLRRVDEEKKKIDEKLMEMAIEDDRMAGEYNDLVERIKNEQDENTKKDLKEKAREIYDRLLERKEIEKKLDDESWRLTGEYNKILLDEGREFRNEHFKEVYDRVKAEVEARRAGTQTARDNGEAMRYNADINEQEGMNDGRAEGAGKSGERNDGFHPGEQAGTVEEAAGRNSRGSEGRTDAAADRRRTAAKRKADCKNAGLERRSAAGEGIQDGSSEAENIIFGWGDSRKGNRIIRHDPELKALVERARAEGVKLRFFLGEIMIEKPDGEFMLRGNTDMDGTVWIQIDNEEVSATELYDHETGHDIYNRADIADETAKIVLNGLSDADIDELYDKYRSAYGGTNMTDEEIMEEIVCDARGGFGPRAEAKDAVRAVFDRADAEMRSAGGTRYDAAVNRNGNSAQKGDLQKHSYAGRNALTADTEQLRRAEEMLKAGEDTEAIRRETGWFKGKDGMWRYEIDDSRAVYDPTGEGAFAAEHPEYARYNELNNKLLYGDLTREEFAELRELDEKWREEKIQLQYRLNNGEATLRDVMHHEGLYRAYPDIARTRVVFAEMKKGVRGSYNPITNTITVNSEYRNKPDEAMGILMHEVQHRIQTAEGFASGASPSYWNKEETYNRARQQVEDNRGRTLLHLTEEERNEYHEYHRLNMEMDELIESSDFAAEGSDRYDELEARSDELYAKLYPEGWFQKLLTYDHLLEDPQALVDYAYSHTAGEEESRDVVSRLKMTAEERKNSPPKMGDENTMFADKRELEAKAIGLTRTNKPFVDVTEDILNGVPQDKWAGTVADNLRTKFPNGITIGSNDIVIDKQSRGEMTHSKYTKWLKNHYPQRYADKLRATNNADEILIAADNWINEPPKHARKDSIIDFARGKVFIRVAGTEYIADVVVGTQRNGKMKLYDVLQMTPASFMQIETNTATAGNPSPGGRRNTALISDDRVAQTDAAVKSENAAAATDGTRPTGEDLREYEAERYNEGNPEDAGRTERVFDAENRRPRYEAERIAEEQGYPLLKREDGGVAKAVPEYTWVMTNDYGNYGVVTGKTADANGNEMLAVWFVNKAKGTDMVVDYYPENLTAVMSEYQGTEGPVWTDEDAPMERNEEDFIDPRTEAEIIREFNLAESGNRAEVAEAVKKAFWAQEQEITPEGNVKHGNPEAVMAEAERDLDSWTVKGRPYKPELDSGASVENGMKVSGSLMTVLSLFADMKIYSDNRGHSDYNITVSGPNNNRGELCHDLFGSARKREKSSCSQMPGVSGVQRSCLPRRGAGRRRHRHGHRLHRMPDISQEHQTENGRGPRGLCHRSYRSAFRQKI